MASFRIEKSLLAAVRHLLRQRTLFMLIVLCVVVGYLLPVFLTTQNLLNVLRQVSITSIVAVGMTFVIITGGIDISVGSTVALSGVVVAYALREGYGLEISIVAALIVSTAAGLLNGVLVSYGKVMAFVATLGTMNLFRGTALIVTNGQAIWGLPKDFVRIGTGYVLGIPIPVIITFVIYISGHLLLTRFTFGRYTLAIGGDEEAARLCGVRVQRIKLLTYGFCGLMSGISGVVLAARLGSGQPSTGTGYELTAIAAAVIGGNSLSGGHGTVWGTLLGALILGVVSNALNLWGVASFYQTVVTGLIVLTAVLVDKLRRKPNSK